MPKRGKPRRGSLQYWPRKRARRIYPTTSTWPETKETVPLGFAGYKAGMLNVICIEKGKHIVRPVTVLDASPLFVCGFRLYQKSSSGLIPLKESWNEKIPNDAELKIAKGKRTKLSDDEINKMSDITDVRLIVCTQPQKSGMKKKKGEIFEIGIGGDIKKKIEYAKSMLGKEINAKDVFKAGEYVDVSAVTKGHGFTGPVKRYGIRIQCRKDKQMHRHVGSIGSTVPRKVDWRVPQAGQYGFFTRTEFNKKIFGFEGKKINPKGGFVGYGLVNNAILIGGSTPGPRKRLIRIRKAERPVRKIEPVEIRLIER